MVRLHPEKLKVRFDNDIDPEVPNLPRKYTLTHSDSTGELFLTIASEYDRKQISGLYTRFMRDEVLAEWILDAERPSLHVYCHVSGGIIFGRAKWRKTIFRQEMPLVLEAIRYGDRRLFENMLEYDKGRIFIHFQKSGKDDSVEDWGKPSDYRI
jgi:hypothetical protein